jgi:F0F1-type ATP synthase gamma subunit
MQITSAMKMVSAAKLKKAQDAITAMRPYAERNYYKTFLQLLKEMWRRIHNVR